ncbi:hypothetical protein EX30DRAFT_343106 [Ascodesmis nigricans]|uniref:Uncharacterized protein n=1 Tax=Ascodesmis nigricans TaxID=341454 RepID=A0A4S2MS91_9PEZI|nr:hypothetical protein EX30DRAFT_343106 [Ascodesmis nigricans]
MAEIPEKIFSGGIHYNLLFPKTDFQFDSTKPSGQFQFYPEINFEDNKVAVWKFYTKFVATRHNSIRHNSISELGGKSEISQSNDGASPSTTSPPSSPRAHRRLSNAPPPLPDEGHRCDKYAMIPWSQPQPGHPGGVKEMIQQYRTTPATDINTRVDFWKPKTASFIQVLQFSNLDETVSFIHTVNEKFQYGLERPTTANQQPPSLSVGVTAGGRFSKLENGQIGRDEDLCAFFVGLPLLRRRDRVSGARHKSLPKFLGYDHGDSPVDVEQAWFMAFENETCAVFLPPDFKQPPSQLGQARLGAFHLLAHMIAHVLNHYDAELWDLISSTNRSQALELRRLYAKLSIEINSRVTGKDRLLLKKISDNIETSSLLTEAIELQATVIQDFLRLLRNSHPTHPEYSPDVNTLAEAIIQVPVVWDLKEHIPFTLHVLEKMVEERRGFKRKVQHMVDDLQSLYYKVLDRLGQTEPLDHVLDKLKVGQTEPLLAMAELTNAEAKFQSEAISLFVAVEAIFLPMMFICQVRFRLNHCGIMMCIMNVVDGFK